MRKILLLVLAVVSTSCSLPSTDRLPSQKQIHAQYWIDQLISLLTPKKNYSPTPKLNLSELETMMREQAPAINPLAIDKVLTTLKCGATYQIAHPDHLTLIDYSMPSNEKRLWVFDLYEKKLLFNTYVTHGIRSGDVLTQYFSNKYNSKASSLGVYATEQSYYGREGLSLRLKGVDPGFNDNASNRAIVMHGAWYMTDEFIKRYGRPGRSWGCPAVPKALIGPIVNTIKNNSLFIVYYPSEPWFKKSKFMRCENFSPINRAVTLQTDTEPPLHDERESILFVDMNKNNKKEDNEPVVTTTADNYERVFHVKAPLDRMLRRQIDHKEYIVLTEKELPIVNADGQWDTIYFVNAEVTMQRGYYMTQMKFVPLGSVQQVHADSTLGYVVEFKARPSLTLKSTHQFIRWIGL